MVVLLAIAYLLMGVLVDAILRDSWEDPYPLCILTWPVALSVMMLFMILGKVISLAEWIKEKTMK